LDAYLSQFQNEDDVSLMQNYDESQVNDTIALYNLEDDDRESCFATAESQAIELPFADEINSTVNGHSDQNVSDPQFSRDLSVASQIVTNEKSPLSSQLNRVKKTLKIANFKGFQLEAIE